MVEDRPRGGPATTLQFGLPVEIDSALTVVAVITSRRIARNHLSLASLVGSRDTELLSAVRARLLLSRDLLLQVLRRVYKDPLSTELRVSNNSSTGLQDILLHTVLHRSQVVAEGVAVPLTLEEDHRECLS